MEKLYKVKRLVLLALIGLIFVTSATPNIYAGEKGKQSANSGIIAEEQKKSSDKLKEIEKTKLNYDLDKKNEGGIDDIGGTVAYFLSSILYKGSRGMGYLSAHLTKFSIDFDLFQKTKSYVKEPMEKMKQLTLGEMKGTIGMFFIAFTMLLVLFLVLKGQVAAGIGRLAQIILLMMLAMFFFISPMKWLANVNEVAHDFGMSVFQYVQDKEYDDEKNVPSTDAAVETVWDIMAKDPWLLLEFDDMSAKMDQKVFEDKESDEYKMFHETNAEERGKLADTLAEKYRPLQSAQSPQTDRLGSAFLMLLMNAVTFVIVLAITLFCLGTQVLILILALLAPFVFILAMFPTKGMNVVRNWALALLGGYIAMAMTLFGYGIFLLMLEIIYGSMMAELGLFFCFVIILAMVIMVILFRHKILGIFGDTTTLRQLESGVSRFAMRRYMNHKREGDSLPIRAGRKALHLPGAAADKAGKNLRESLNNTEIGKEMSARKLAKQQDQNAQKEDREREIRNRADQKRNYYSQREQDQNVKSNVHTAKPDSNQVAGSHFESAEDKNKQTQNTEAEPHMYVGNMREQVRRQQQQQKENRHHPQNLSEQPKWKKDENGVPYRTDSPVGKSIREQVRQSQQLRPKMEAGVTAGQGREEVASDRMVVRKRSESESDTPNMILATRQGDPTSASTEASSVQEKSSVTRPRTVNQVGHQGQHSDFQLYNEKPGQHKQVVRLSTISEEVTKEKPVISRHVPKQAERAATSTRQSVVQKQPVMQKQTKQSKRNLGGNPGKRAMQTAAPRPRPKPLPRRRR